MKNVITSYTFDASAKTIDFSGYAGFTPERLVAIFNATDNTLIYGQGVASKGYTNFAAGVLTLEYNTTTMDDADDLQVIYIPGDYATQATLADILAKIIAAPSTEAKQDTGNTHLSNISGKLPSSLGQTNMAGSMSVAIASNQSAIPVTKAPVSDGSSGLTIHRAISAASTNATSVKASAGNLHTIIATNVNAAVRYLKIYNKASSPTVGTNTPVLTVAIPGNTAGAGIVIPFPDGVNLSAGLAYALTTGVADSDTGAVAANEIIVQLAYK